MRPRITMTNSPVYLPVGQLKIFQKVAEAMRSVLFIFMYFSICIFVLLNGLGSYKFCLDIRCNFIEAGRLMGSDASSDKILEACPID